MEPKFIPSIQFINQNIPKSKGYEILEFKTIETAKQTESEIEKRLVPTFKKLKTIEFPSQKSVYVWPKLGYIENPRVFLQENGVLINMIQIGSRAWWLSLDYLRISGVFEKDQVHYFLKQSAIEIENKTQFPIHTNMQSTKKPELFVEKFILYYPDETIQKQKVNIEYNRLLNDVRKSYKNKNINPFKPKNYDELVQSGKNPFLATPEELGGPQNINFIFKKNQDMVNCDNFLRYFTNYTRDKNGNLIQGIDGIIEVMPATEQWVPEEYRTVIYKEYELTEYKYLDNDKWAQFFYHLSVTHQQTDPKLQSLQNKPQTFIDDKNVYIPIKDENAKMYKLSVRSCKITYNTNKYIKGKIDPRTEMRVWRIYNESFFDDDKLYKLYRFIVNVPPYIQGMTPEEKELYTIQLYFINNTKVYRLNSFAPLKFYHQALLYYFGNNTHTSDEECETIFINNFYYEYVKKYEPELPEKIPDSWKEILLQLYYLNRKECHHVTTKSKILSRHIKNISGENIPNIDIMNAPLSELKKHNQNIDIITKDLEMRNIGY